MPAWLSPLVSFERTAEGTPVRDATNAGAYRARGLRPGDLVLRANEVPDPLPSTLARLFTAAQPNTFVVFTIRRGSEQRIVAVSVQTDVPPI